MLLLTIHFIWWTFDYNSDPIQILNLMPITNPNFGMTLNHDSNIVRFSYTSPVVLYWVLRYSWYSRYCRY